MKRILHFSLTLLLAFVNLSALPEKAFAALPSWGCGAGSYTYYPATKGPYNVPTDGWALGSRLCTTDNKADIVSVCPSTTTEISYKIQPSLEQGRSAEIRRVDIFSWVITSPPDMKVTVTQSKGVTYKSSVAIILVYDADASYYSERQWNLPRQYNPGGTKPKEPDAKAQLYTLREYREYQKWQRICVNSSTGKPIKVISRATDLIYFKPGLSTGTPIWREEMAGWTGDTFVKVSATAIIPPVCPSSSNNNYPTDTNYKRIPKNTSLSHGSNTSSSWGLSIPIGAFGNVSATSGTNQVITVTWTNENKVYPRTVCVKTGTSRNFTTFSGFGDSETTPGLVIGVTTQN